MAKENKIIRYVTQKKNKYLLTYKGNRYKITIESKSKDDIPRVILSQIITDSKIKQEIYGLIKKQIWDEDEFNK